ncbi:hypothetical protein E2C01_083690 [Portunus trituberculatus]|uniref:Uncharacterized protein n=1 Tax=Portunus trituberculatus TaxID=210409 RepID=A0A5B7J2D4_PORTR|nr:hypothetical protein [Portunus trituberculatus]
MIVYYLPSAGRWGNAATRKGKTESHSSGRGGDTGGPEGEDSESVECYPQPCHGDRVPDVPEGGAGREGRRC